MNTDPTFSLPTPPNSLALDARRVAMLEAMGLRLWWPGVAPQDASLVAPRVPSAPSVPATAGASRRVGADHTPAQTENSIKNQHKIGATNPPNKSDRGNFNKENTSKKEEHSFSPPTSPLTPPDARGMDWETLEHTVRNCTACGLCQRRTQTVLGMGPRQAAWMVVGEGPGEQEDRQGLPFVGPAGQLLDAMLAAMGLSRERDVYITNAVKCRPPQNRNPEPAEWLQCRPYLLRQIELVQPRLILSLGRFATHTLLDEAVPGAAGLPLGRLRGQVHALAGRPVVVSYHPAYLLRNPADKGKAWQDLCLALSQMNHNPLSDSAHRSV
jgi:DNA polymerase